MEIEQFLDRLDLSQYEKHAYMALLRLGRANLFQYARVCKVRYGWYFRNIEKLVMMLV